MKAISKVLAGGVAIAALASAAPAAAQYYPGYGYPGYGYGGNPSARCQSGAWRRLWQLWGQQPGAVNQCAAAVQQRLNGGYGYGPYGYNSEAMAAARVLGISRVEPRSNGGLTVRGVASSGRYSGYTYGSPGASRPHLEVQDRLSRVRHRYRRQPRAIQLRL